MSTSDVMIRIRDLHKSYGDNAVLKGIDLEVDRSQVVVVIGPSGSGKSTLLRCCNGLEVAERGTIELCGERLLDEGALMPEKALNHLRTRVGMVFQSFNLFPHLTVLENVTIGPRTLRGASAAQADEKGLALLTKVGLESKARAMPNSLSGGQKQRVAIARALAMQPEIMLFDEVTSALDPEMVDEVLQVLRDISAETRMTMLMVTHQMSFAHEFSDQILFLDKGRIVEQGTPDKIFREPQEERTRLFLSKIAAAGQDLG